MFPGFGHYGRLACQALDDGALIGPQGGRERSVGAPHVHNQSSLKAALCYDFIGSVTPCANDWK
jgi:hypothetical protein